MEKRRSGNDDHAEAMTLIGPDPEGRETILYDDEILTGGTVSGAIELLQGRGARSTYVSCVHPYFRGPAFERLDTPDVTELVYTDTVPVEEGRVPAHPADRDLARAAVRRRHLPYSHRRLGERALPLSARRAGRNPGSTGMVGVFRKVMGNANERALKKLRPQADAVNEHAEDVAALSDAELRASTDRFRARLREGETLDDLLPEAFAVAREAIARDTGERAYDVQVLGAVALAPGHGGGDGDRRG